MHAGKVIFGEVGPLAYHTGWVLPGTCGTGRPLGPLRGGEPGTDGGLTGGVSSADPLFALLELLQS